MSIDILPAERLYNLVHNFKGYLNQASLTDTKRKLADVENLHYYTRIYYPMSSFKEFFQLNVDFNPFQDDVAYLMEIDSTKSVGASSDVRVMKVSISKDGIFDIEKDVEFVGGITITGADYYTMVENLKKLASSSNFQNYKDEIDKGMLSGYRYIPDTVDLIEHLDFRPLKKEIILIYENLFKAVEFDEVFDVAKMVSDDFREIVKVVIVNILSTICGLPNNLWSKFMDAKGDLSEHMIKALKTRVLSDLIMFEPLTPFMTFAKHFKMEEGFRDHRDTTNVEIRKIHQDHIIKIYEYIRTVFKPLYIAAKQNDTVSIRKASDSDFEFIPSILGLEDDTFVPDYVRKHTPKFEPTPNNDYQTTVRFQYDRPEPYLYLPSDMADQDKNSLLLDFNVWAGYDKYQQLHCSNRRRLLTIIN